MQVKTSELTGVALDWAVAKCEGCSKSRLNNVDIWQHIRQQGAFRFSTDWSQGGPIIEREMRLGMNLYGDGDTFGAAYYNIDAEDTEASSFGETPLIAAMRCYVASKLGDVVDIPDELLEVTK